MKVAERKLIFHYNVNDLSMTVTQAIDSALEEALKPFGYVLIGCGTDLQEWVRDLEFERE